MQGTASVPDKQRPPIITIDLLSPQGNSYYIMAQVTSFLKQTKQEHLVEEYAEQAKSHDYKHLIRTSENYTYGMIEFLNKDHYFNDDDDDNNEEQ